MLKKKLMMLRSNKKTVNNEKNVPGGALPYSAQRTFLPLPLCLGRPETPDPSYFGSCLDLHIHLMTSTSILTVGTYVLFRIFRG